MPWSSSTARSERERAAVRHVAYPVLSNGPVASSRTHGGSGDVHAEDPLISALAIVLATSGCTSRSGNPFRVATGYISHVVCSYVFVSGLDAERVYAEEIDANPAFRGFKWALSHQVDRDKHEVRARALGGFETRSVYRDGL